ncbi:uncharacterized protein KGF55_001657 [Candida pseudojiufengensis]|uniref:uncharacterized protein n=1 Tax=Candida pseudojiufengensis TaxID=497109 RepID=UPI0022247ACD|nr:uncharacterized protein KGF55_001657 [Candida pseudojiufengensis]KAI5964588.1 hypothetical protein KGF55_001657 [Candida pseudojiufengensis]
MSFHSMKKDFILTVLNIEVPKFIQIYFHIPRQEIISISQIILDNIHENSINITELIEEELGLYLGKDIVIEIFKRYRELINVFNHFKIPGDMVCPNGDNCPGNICTLWHPSKSNLTRVPEYRAPTLTYFDPYVYPQFLQQCLMVTCNNMDCVKRHPTSSYLCRNGAECPRINCYYYHDFSQDCKFGEDCSLNNCPFNHEDSTESTDTEYDHEKYLSDF